MICPYEYSIMKLSKDKGVVSMGSLKLFNYSRTSTLIFLRNTEESLWDEQPAPFPNNIRWNAGHVYVTAEDFLKDADTDYPIKHPEWDNLFLDGTRPSEWGDDVPSAAEIIAALEEQQARINNHFEGKITQQATKPRDVNGTMLDTIDANLQFVTWHEGLHLGIAKQLRTAQK